jgi:beta-N-acetylhexosaminidase
MAEIGAFISGCAGPVLSAAERNFFASRNPWGLILFKRNCETPEQIRALTSAFRAAVGRRDAPVFVDQEGGRVQRLGPPSNAWRQYPAARAYGELYQRDPLAAVRAARLVARLMAEDLLAAGITANCVPVLDVPQSGSHDVIGSRAYAERVDQIIALGGAHAAGFLAGGIAPVMKHMPGHGRARADSHHELPRVDATPAELRAVDFVPFAALAGLPMAMTAHIVYTALDSNAPATLSRRVIGEVIRGEIGFDGLLITDDLSMKALSGSLAERARLALEAGCDVALHCNGVLSEMEEVAAAAGSLSKPAAGRARRALKMATKPRRFDRKAAEASLQSLVAG